MGLGKEVRRRLGYAVFAILMIWPIIHMALVHHVGISSWRLFGWGMYATPIPMDQSRLRVVIRDHNDSKAIDLVRLHSSIAKLSADPKEESLCINLFLQGSNYDLVKLPRTGLCRNRAHAKNLDYFMHFGSSKHLKEFVHEAMAFAHRSQSEAYAFFTRQRFNLLQSRAYVESDVYGIFGNEVRFYGTIKDEALGVGPSL